MGFKSLNRTYRSVSVSYVDLGQMYKLPFNLKFKKTHLVQPGVRFYNIVQLQYHSVCILALLRYSKNNIKIKYKNISIANVLGYSLYQSLTHQSLVNSRHFFFECVEIKIGQPMYMNPCCCCSDKNALFSQQIKIKIKIEIKIEIKLKKSNQYQRFV